MPRAEPQRRIEKDLFYEDFMLTYEEAKKLVEERLSEIQNRRAETHKEVGPTLVLLEEHTIELPYGWVFFYQSKQFIENPEDYRFMLVGNAPYIVDKYTGQLVVTGTAYQTEHYIQEYTKKRMRTD